MTRAMTRWTLAGCMALAALGAVAVLDVGAPTAVAAQDASPFAGSWSGTWYIVEIDTTGTFDWTISDAGRIDGTLTHTSNDVPGGAVTGQVSADGSLLFVGQTPSDEPGGGSGHNGFPFKGTAVIHSDGKLFASAAQACAPFPLSLSATLERK
jgi:hypothetical protein